MATLADADHPGTLESVRLQMCFGAVELREYNPSDALVLFELRNHPSIRTFMPSPEPIERQSHLSWLRKHVGHGRDVRLFIVRFGGLPIGFTVLKRLPGDDLELGVLFKEANKHPGIPAQTAALMLHLCFDLIGHSTITTFVNARHTHALSFNKGFGLVEVASQKPNERRFMGYKHDILASERYQMIMTRVRRTLVVEYLKPNVPDCIFQPIVDGVSG